MTLLVEELFHWIIAEFRDDEDVINNAESSAADAITAVLLHRSGGLCFQKKASDSVD